MHPYPAGFALCLRQHANSVLAVREVNDEGRSLNAETMTTLRKRNSPQSSTRKGEATVSPWVGWYTTFSKGFIAPWLPTSQDAEEE